MAGYPRPALVVAALALGILGGCSDASDGPAGSPQPVDAQVDPTATTRTQPTLTPGEEWLYARLVGTSSPGDTGTRRKVEVDGVRSTHSTTYWVGCEGRPAVARFALQGRYAALSTRLLLDDATTPPALQVRVVLTADGRRVGTWTVAKSDRFEVDVDGLEGVRLLRLSALALNPEECTNSVIGYGIALDARLS
jgi:hypothetical protein